MSQAGMEKSKVLNLEPRLVDGQAMLIAGLRKHYGSETMNDIPLQWERFAKHIGNVPNQVGRVAYGVCSNLVMTPFSFDYLSGVEVSRAADLPSEFNTASIPAARYAIFPHHEHISKIRDTIDAIWNKWLPTSGHAPRVGTPDMPYMMERYGEGFDPQKGMGDVELWIPLAS
jgi:AraC family transcriptional regulator